MSPRPNSLAAKDAAFHFHGYTNALKNEKDGGFVVTRGKGVYIYDEDGKEYMDGLAGLWCCSLGFGEVPRITQAIVAQMQALPYYHTFTQKTAAVVVELAEKLVSLAPVPMSKAYFCNSGSEANDTVIKMVRYLNNGLGRTQKKKFISRVKAYHGVTVAAGSLTGLPAIHKDFDLPIAGILHTDCPHYYRFGQPGETEEQFATRCAESLEKMILAEGPDTVAAFIAEPVMGAGGVIVPPRTYWDKIQAVLKKYDVLLVADEVLTGAGRTGTWSALEPYGVVPDIMTLGKGIAGGYVPLSAVVTSRRVAEPLARGSGALAHAQTFSHHPVLCAAGVATLRYLRERRLVERCAEMGRVLHRRLAELRDLPLVGDVRGRGLLAGIEFVADTDSREPLPRSARFAEHFTDAALEEGLVVWPNVGHADGRNGDLVMLAPPFIVTEDQIDELLELWTRALWRAADRLGATK